MKIACFDNNDKRSEFDSFTLPNLYLKPETSLLLKNRPFYIPDGVEDLKAEIFFGVKINRIGKHIAEKFANKYFSELLFGVNLINNSLFNRIKGNGLPWDLAKNFDYSCALSSISNIIEMYNNNESIDLKINNVKVLDYSLYNFKLDFSSLICEASKNFALKIGDIIMSSSIFTKESLKIGDKIELIINSHSILKVDIK